jgi:hypothetical protein
MVDKFGKKCLEITKNKLRGKKKTTVEVEGRETMKFDYN